MSVKEYTEEFYKVNITTSYVEDTIEMVSIYINGLRLDIQYEMSMLTLNIVEEAYQFSLKGEETL